MAEPGRGIISSPARESPTFVMTNFSLWDMMHQNGGIDCGRYRAVTEALAKADDMDVDAAFAILDVARQHSGEWITELSMVYSKKSDIVFYRINEGNAKSCALAF